MSFVEAASTRLKNDGRQLSLQSLCPDTMVPATMFCQASCQTKKLLSSTKDFVDLVQYHAYRTRPGSVLVSKCDYPSSYGHFLGEQQLTFTMLWNCQYETARIQLIVPPQNNGNWPRLRFISLLTNGLPEEKKIDRMISALENQREENLWKITDWTIALAQCCQ